MSGTNELGARIAALIQAQGPLGIAQYMTLALHDPKGGYYATRDPFGSGGDFTTAPEITQMFGEMLGLWCVQVWHDQGCPKNPRLVELGPGRGTLMADALRAAARAAPRFLDGLEVALVEASPTLRALQKDRLAGSGADVRWLGHFDESLSDRPLLLLANEFFDALPIRQYVKTARGWCERMVTAGDGALDFALAPIASPAAVPGSGAPEGGVHEVCPSGLALAEEIARIVALRGGGALIIDYGYDARTGHGETLQAVGGHRFADVLADPGENDLSAHVDFAALAAAGARGGARVHGPSQQGRFLAELGLVARAETLMQSNPAEAQALFGAVERLIDPARMGTLFKALALMPPGAPLPPGFAPPAS